MELNDKNTQLFLYLVGTFEMSTLHHLGKLKNPLTDRIERNLDQAQMSIDLLDMLKEKTNGNLSTEEQRHLDHVVSQLKLNYLDEMNKPETKTEAETVSGEESTPEKETGQKQEEKKA